MTDATVDQLHAEAARIAAANPPSRVALIVIGGFFGMIGWIIGRSWFFVAKLVAFTALNMRYGYRKGVKAQVAPPQPPPQPQNTPYMAAGVQGYPEG